MQKRTKVYIAGPLFSHAERSFNADLKRKLAPYFDVYLPQEDGGLLTECIREGMDVRQAMREIYRIDIHAVRTTDIVLIILDGRTVDEGASYELGFGKAIGKLCYGLQTDVRRLLPMGNNPMIEVPLKRIFEDEAELLKWAKRYTSRHS